ncbi:MAG: EAL domain-containing protein [Methylococcus sp.]|nr:EAL domain-containing protein [Methylococcus sp.]
MKLGEGPIEENALFRAMIECMRDQVITVHDTCDGGRIVYANEPACRHFGVDLDTLLTWRPLDFDPNFDAARVQGLIGEQDGTVASCYFESVHRVSTGEVIPVEVALSPFDLHGRRLAMCLVRDLRPRLEAENHLKEMERLKAERESMSRLSRFAQCAPGFMYSVERQSDGRVAMTYASKGVEDVLGLGVQSVLDDIGRIYALILPEDLEQMRKRKEASRLAMAPFLSEYRIRHPRKGMRWLEARSVPERLADGTTLWHGFIVDITERKRTEETLRFIAQRGWAAEGGEFFPSVARYLGQTLGTDYVVIDRLTQDPAIAETVALYARGEIAPNLRYGLSGTPCENVMGRTLCCYARGVQQLFSEDNMLRDMGVESYAGIPLWDSAGAPIGLIAVMDGKPMGDTDLVTALLQIVAARVAGALERERSEYRLKTREQEFRSLVEHSPDTVARYDGQCRRIYANPRLVEESGVPVSEMLDKTPAEFPGGKSACAYQDKIREVLETGRQEDFELTWKTARGEDIVSHIRLTPERDADGEIRQVLAVGRDITEIDAYRRQIQHMAFFDSLTGLPNRELLNSRIKEVLADSAVSGRRLALMMLDMDRFKEVNDTLGHGVGDKLLEQAASRLTDAVRCDDVVARLGGDEFAVLLPDIRNGADLNSLAGRILGALAEPFQIEGRELFASASIGIALYPGDCIDIDTLFRCADSAMYYAKKQGRNNFQFYIADLTERASERMLIESALRKAQERNELELYFQPQVDLATGRVVGAEALLRWNRDGERVVLPGKFIHVAEETGVIVSIGEWALGEACRAAVSWNRGREKPVRVAVNLSTRQFILNDLAGTVVRILAETGCRPEWLELEITESLLLEDSGEITETLDAFNAMGVSISIDDFGTGYSSLSYLHRFPVRRLKIDRSFVHGLPSDRRKTALIKAMIAMAHALKLEVVGEGVETVEQGAYLQAHGCRLMQGFLCGKPTPRAQFEALLLAEKP